MPSTLFAAALETKDYIVGEANASSGLYCLTFDGTWTHLGWKNVRCFGVTLSPDGTIYLACGNGVLRSRDEGKTWRVTTGWEITEVLRLAMDPTDSLHLCAATAHGIWTSTDGGETWISKNNGLTKPSSTFAQTVSFNCKDNSLIIIGTEKGIYRSNRSTSTWIPAGPWVPIRALLQHPEQHEIWLAGTEDQGVLISKDHGLHWDPPEGPQQTTSIYALAFDPTQPSRCVAAGYQSGLFLSENGGISWTHHLLNVPAHSVHALAFDPDVAGRLWVGTIGHGLFHTDDFGETCTFAGLAETTLYDLVFVT